MTCPSMGAPLAQEVAHQSHNPALVVQMRYLKVVNSSPLKWYAGKVINLLIKVSIATVLLTTHPNLMRWPNMGASLVQ